MTAIDSCIEVLSTTLPGQLQEDPDKEGNASSRCLGLATLCLAVGNTVREQYRSVSSRGNTKDHTEADARLYVKRHSTQAWFWNFQQSDGTGDRLDLVLNKDRNDKPIFEVRMRPACSDGGSAVRASRTYAMVSTCNWRSALILLPDGSTSSEKTPSSPPHSRISGTPPLPLVRNGSDMLPLSLTFSN